MAGKIHDEQLKVNIVINGNKAQKELGNLQRKERALIKTQKELRKEAAKLVAAGKKQSEAYNNLTAEIKENKKSLETNKTKQIALRKQIGITSLTTGQLRREQKRLGAIMRQFSPNTPQWKGYNEELKKVNRQLSKVQQEMKGTDNIIGRLNRRFNSFSGILAAVGYYQAVAKIKKLVTANADLAESQTDVQKTTALTDKGIKVITRSLKKLKTRSKVKELLDIAEAAGRLGKRGVEDIEKFVKAGDQINVALGDDLVGTTEENIRVIGKIADNYEIASREGVDFAKSMEMVGSSINEVSASGSTQADFLVDYLKRLAGVSKQAKISAQDQIGYAAVLDEAGQSVEVSGTAMSTVMFNMFADTKTYADIAKTDIKDFTNLMNKDANAAFLLFLKGLNGNGAGLQKMAEKMKDLGLKGAKSIGILTTLAAATGKIREKQILANKALKENISLAAEFKNKNENLPALLERISNWFHNIFTGGWIADSLKEVVLWFAKLLGVSEDTDGSLGRFRSTLSFLVKILLIAATAVVSYKAAVQLSTLWTNRATLALKLNTIAAKVNAAATTFGKGAMLLLKAAFFAVTGQTKKATMAMRAFGVVTKLNPIGLLVTAVTTAIVAFKLFSKEVKQSNYLHKLYVETSKRAAKSTAAEKSQLQSLLLVAKNEKISKKERLKAIKKLNNISPEYLGNLTLETINTKEATVAINKYIESLNQKALSQAFQDKRTELATEKINKQTASLDKYKSTMKSMGDDTVGKVFDFFLGEADLPDLKNIKELDEYAKKTAKGNINLQKSIIESYTPYIKKKEEDVRSTQEQIDKLDEYYKKLLEEGKIKIQEDTGLDAPSEGEQKIINGKLHVYKGGKWVLKKSGGSGEGEDGDLSDADKKIIESRKRLKELLKQLQEDQEFQDLLSGQISREESEDQASLDAYDKEIEQILKKGLEKEELLAELERAKNERLKAINDEWDENRVIEEEEKELYAKENEFEKLEEQAAGDAELLAQLEDLKQSSVQAIIDKWEKYREKQSIKEQEKFLKNDSKFKKELIKAEEVLQKAKSDALTSGISALKGFAKEGTAAYKALFLAENLLAGMQIVTKNQEETAGYFKAYSAIPGGALIAAKHAAAAKIRMFTSLGILAGQTVQGFEDGLYPVTRNDGKKFNAKLGTTKTGLVTQPTLMDGSYLAGERSTVRNPEMIIDDVTFSKLDPNVISYITNVHNGTVSGYETGKYPQNNTAEVKNYEEEEITTNKNEYLTIEVIELLRRIAESSEKGATLVFGYEEAQKVFDLQEENNSSKQNGKF